LKQKCDYPLSSFAFNFNLCRCIWAKKFRGLEQVRRETFVYAVLDAIEERLVPDVSPALDEGSSAVWRCKLTPGCPRVVRAWCRRWKVKYHEPLSGFAFN